MSLLLFKQKAGPRRELKNQLTKKDECQINSQVDQDLECKCKHSLPIINCTCGAQILVVPDAKAMDRAINSHLVKHKNINEHTRIVQLLTAQIFDIACKRSK